MNYFLKHSRYLLSQQSKHVFPTVTYNHAACYTRITQRRWGVPLSVRRRVVQALGPSAPSQPRSSRLAPRSPAPPPPALLQHWLPAIGKKSPLFFHWCSPDRAFVAQTGEKIATGKFLATIKSQNGEEHQQTEGTLMTKSLATQSLCSSQRHRGVSRNSLCLRTTSHRTTSHQVSEKTAFQALLRHACSPSALFQLVLSAEGSQTQAGGALGAGSVLEPLPLSAMVKKIRLGRQELQRKALKAQLLITKGNAKNVAINLCSQRHGWRLRCWLLRKKIFVFWSELFPALTVPGTGLLCWWVYCQIKCHSQNQPFRGYREIPRFNILIIPVHTRAHLSQAAVWACMGLFDTCVCTCILNILVFRLT